MRERVQNSELRRSKELATHKFTRMMKYRLRKKRILTNVNLGFYVGEPSLVSVLN